MKNFALLFFFLFFSSSLLNAQEKKDSIINRKNKSSLGLSYSFNYCYRKLSFTQPIEENQIRYKYMLEANKNEIPNYGYSINMFYAKKIKHNISYRIGLAYDKVSYKSIVLEKWVYPSSPYGNLD